MIGILFCFHQHTPAKNFPVLYAIVAYIFSTKMSRLIIICGPIVSMLAGYPVGILFDWCLEQFLRQVWSWKLCEEPVSPSPNRRVNRRNGRKKRMSKAQTCRRKASQFFRSRFSCSMDPEEMLPLDYPIRVCRAAGGMSSVNRSISVSFAICRARLRSM